MIKLLKDSQVIICALLQLKFGRIKTLKGQNYVKLDMDPSSTSLISEKITYPWGIQG